MTTFKDLGLSEGFLKTLEAIGFKEPTEIQAKAIPLGLEGKDLIGESATGTGKTLAFGASIIEKSIIGKNVQSLILTPTRELAEQVGTMLKRLSRHTKLRVAVVYGGVGLGPQVEEIAHSEVLVGTPGRLLDHLKRGSLHLKNVTTLVLDEADKMLDMGFVEDVMRIIELCPKDRQTFLFSATMSPDIVHISKHYMREPVEISSGAHVDPSKLKQIFYDVARDQKFSLLVHLLKQERTGLVMVFCSTRTNADFVGDNLKRNDIHALTIHGGLSQKRRNEIMEAFHKKDTYVLVCTDVAARGLDIKNVSHVYNYDLPNNSKEYVHRIGRTARAGKEGCAISIVSARDYENFRRVLQDPALKITQEDLPQFASVPFRASREGNFGRRPFGKRLNRNRDMRRHGR